jgi:hypothetical protein
MALVAKSLDAATSTGPGTLVEFDVPKSIFSMEVVADGSPSSVVVTLQGTLDGTHFVTLGTVSLSGNDFNIIHATSVYVAVRANLTTLSGGSSPTVTATIAAA